MIRPVCASTSHAKRSDDAKLLHMDTIHRYTDLRPSELAQRLERCPVAIAPWGALEWHGPHLPFGLDGLVAEGFCELLAARTGGVLLPTTYLPITSLPHAYSLSTRTEIVRGVWQDLFAGLGRAGVQVICLVSGHYAHGHELVLTEVAEAAMHDGGPLVLAGTPLALIGEPELLDHAGRWETAQLLRFRPELVDLDAIPAGPLPHVSEVAVLGDDPRDATAEDGDKIVQHALEVWTGWIDKLLAERTPEPLLQLYSNRRAGYQDFVDRYYRDSWEDAIEAWWQDRIS
jgi:creatinine amidohydrolase